MPKLFEPITVRGLEVRNRAWIPPMCMYSCENRDGVVNDWHVMHLGGYAAGGAGLIIAEASAVNPVGRITPWDAGIWSDAHIEPWLRVNNLIHSLGAKSAIQLAHAGRKASTYREWSGSGSVPEADGGWQTVSATDVPFGEYAAPRQLETKELANVVADFVYAAKRSVKAGFDAVEIHAAHGYLIHQFLSPITNKRTDAYGGSLENRARLLLEIVESIRMEIPETMPLMVRFSATDYAEDGWDAEQTAEVAEWCAKRGADLFDISSGGLITGVQIPTGPGYQVPLAEQIADAVPQPVSAVGQITQAAQAEEILQSGKVEIVMLGRISLHDPQWALRAAQQLGVEVDYAPKQYRRGVWAKN